MVQQRVCVPNFCRVVIHKSMMMGFCFLMVLAGPNSYGQTTTNSTGMSTGSSTVLPTKASGAAKPVAKKTPSKKAESAPAHSKGPSTLQEGWYKVTVGKVPAGYFIQRVEFDSSTKQFIATTYLKTSSMGGNITESLKAYADEKLKPQSYQYTYMGNDGNKTIDATFQGWVGTFTTTKDGKSTSEQKKFREGTLLSAHLIYSILRNKAGLKVGNNYAYAAIAEEKATAYSGEAWIKEEVEIKGEHAFRIFNTFGPDKFVNVVTPTGNLISGKSPEADTEYVLVNSREEAVGSVPVNDKQLALLFGQVPAVQKSMVAPALTPADSGATGAAKSNKLKLPPTGDGSTPKENIPEGLSVPVGKGGATAPAAGAAPTSSGAPTAPAQPKQPSESKDSP